VDEQSQDLDREQGLDTASDANGESRRQGSSSACALEEDVQYVGQRYQHTYIKRVVER
jgi:hypothetical protein